VSPPARATGHAAYGAGPAVSRPAAAPQRARRQGHPQHAPRPPLLRAPQSSLRSSPALSPPPRCSRRDARSLCCCWRCWWGPRSTRQQLTPQPDFAPPHATASGARLPPSVPPRTPEVSALRKSRSHAAARPAAPRTPFSVPSGATRGHRGARGEGANRGTRLSLTPVVPRRDGLAVGAVGALGGSAASIWTGRAAAQHPARALMGSNELSTNVTDPETYCKALATSRKMSLSLTQCCPMGKGWGSRARVAGLGRKRLGQAVCACALCLRLTFSPSTPHPLHPAEFTSVNASVSGEGPNTDTNDQLLFRWVAPDGTTQQQLYLAIDMMVRCCGASRGVLGETCSAAHHASTTPTRSAGPS